MKKCGNFYALSVKKYFYLKMCQLNITVKFQHTGVSAANTDKKYWRESLYVLAKAETRRGFLRGRIRETAVNSYNAVIIGGIRAAGSISKSGYPVLLPLKWTVIHKRCGHGTPLVRPTRSAKNEVEQKS